MKNIKTINKIFLVALMSSVVATGNAVSEAQVVEAGLDGQAAAEVQKPSVLSKVGTTVVNFGSFFAKPVVKAGNSVKKSVKGLFAPRVQAQDIVNDMDNAIAGSYIQPTGKSKVAKFGSNIAKPFNKGGREVRVLANSVKEKTVNGINVAKSKVVRTQALASDKWNNASKVQKAGVIVAATAAVSFVAYKLYKSINRKLARRAKRVAARKLAAQKA